MKTLTVVLHGNEKEEVWVAEVPEVYGCRTQGKSIEQTLERVVEALKVCDVPVMAKPASTKLPKLRPSPRTKYFTELVVDKIQGVLDDPYGAFQDDDDLTTPEDNAKSWYNQTTEICAELGLDFWEVVEKECTEDEITRFQRMVGFPV